MRLVAFLADDGPAVGLLVAGERVVRLRAVNGGIDLALAEDGLPALVEEARRIAEHAATDGARAGTGASAGVAGEPLADLACLPAVEFPGKVVCIGLNYDDHVREGGRKAPPRPLIFGKFGNTVVGDGEPIVRPEGTAALDLEAELGVVIGRRARRVSAANAMDHVAGYIVVNDVSARDWQGVPVALAEGEQGDGQWLRAKGSDTFLPIGPVLVTPDEVDPVAGLRIRSWRIPGGGPDAGVPVLMQDGSTADMTRRVPELIEYVTKAITLEPGDIIATGTPSGVGVYRTPPVFLVPGDRVRCEIEGIGSVENPVVDWSDVVEEEA
jgi:2-keto-4-pentenoate hydratase/2-oxohepta-3-ene-1,7-dioic acid hydratase in catechol pathway